MNNLYSFKTLFLSAIIWTMLVGSIYCQPFDVRILNPPQDGLVVSSYVSLSGTAIIPFGFHLWVFVSYGSNRNLWWPISEVRIDQQRRSWNISVPIGGSRDSGIFYIAVGPVNENEHQNLEQYMRQLGGKGDYGPRPIRSPMFSFPPTYRMVNKR
ncbi:hypothetical protein [Desulfosarcina variabilis]|uniref:hypothetical protein n=1 Tax=Desulfosarcina variabilis TaxID=2300 RepID=UPI003AFA73F4